jgi:hypothetical protein
VFEVDGTNDRRMRRLPPIVSSYRIAVSHERTHTQPNTQPNTEHLSPVDLLDPITRSATCAKVDARFEHVHTHKTVSTPTMLRICMANPQKEGRTDGAVALPHAFHARLATTQIRYHVLHVLHEHLCENKV